MSFFLYFFIYLYMSMIDEIDKLMVDLGASNNYRIVNLSGKNLYIEGIKSVICFGLEEMRFQLKNKQLIVLGRALKVRYLDKTTCVLCGEISSVVVQWSLIWQDIILIIY